MKKSLLLALALCLYMPTSFGQQFSFQMFFTDAIGNKDTIILGYDPLATDSIDASFGETNIISVPYDTTLDVRITNQWITDQDPIVFHTKKQIVFYDCTYTNWSIQSINIVTQHWPVTVTWDHSLFNDTCRYGSVFTSMNPGGWWDVGCPSNLWREDLFLHDSATFTTNVDPSGVGWFSYINGSGDSIPVFWQAFADSSMMTANIPKTPIKNEVLTVFPNPTSEDLIIQANNGNENFQIQIVNDNGKILYDNPNFKGEKIDTRHFPGGVYLIKYSDERNRSVKRFVVQH